ncbi:MAG TPA: response regulator transcription factor [Candidatus Deferrimicrobiaceae bacterium]
MIRVLIADDHEIFRQGLAELLRRKQGIDVAGTAGDGEEALSLLPSIRPDVLILDLSMPVKDGFEVTRRVRELHLDVKILVLSMHKDPGSVRRALALGVDGFILKDEAFNDLERAIEVVMAGGRFLSPPVRSIANRHAGTLEHEPLTSRERQVVGLIAVGKSTREIARELGIGIKTVETHRQHIMDKLGFRKTAQIAVYAIREGLVD